MPPDAESLAQFISEETGLHFEGRSGRDEDNQPWIELTPAGHRAAQTFTIQTTIGWRSLEVDFLLGGFAKELLAGMSRPDEAGQTLFDVVLSKCVADQAEVQMELNGQQRDFSDPAIWTEEWHRMTLQIRRRMLPINAGDEEVDFQLVSIWTGRMAAAAVAILPLERPDENTPEPDHEGLPEGAKVRVEVNRYERDRRNRAAALAIHGYACKCCDIDMGELYGSAAAGLIEVHHVTPVSVLGPGYVINPATDLLPLCPNCHAVAHRRTPPFSVMEIRQMLGG